MEKKDLKSLRKKIDSIDDQLLDLIIERSSVVEKIRSEILSGILDEDTPLREMQLAKKYNVGRSKVREALLILCNENPYVHEKYYLTDYPYKYYISEELQ